MNMKAKKDYESEILDIVETEDWSRARCSNSRNLYCYIQRYKDTDENCKIIWEHIKAGREHLSIKRYLFYYFKHGKPTNISNKNLYIWFTREINKGNQCCIDIKKSYSSSGELSRPGSNRNFKPYQELFRRRYLTFFFFSV